MLGFLIGTVCLLGLARVIRGGGRWRSYGGYGHGGAWGHGGSCGHRGGWHRGYEGRGGYEDDDSSPWGGDEGRGRGGERFWLRALFERLDTTPGQEKAIRAALDELRTKARAVKDDARGMRGDVATALRGESLDAETLGTVASRASGAVDALRDAGIGAVLKVHEVLDERQRATLADFLESGPRFGRGWRGRGRGGPYRGAARA